MVSIVRVRVRVQDRDRVRLELYRYAGLTGTQIMATVKVRSCRWPFYAQFFPGTRLTGLT